MLEPLEPEPVVSKVYTTHYEPDLAVLADSDRARLQKLLLTAELDLETLNFSDPVAVEKFVNTSRQVRSELASLKRANFDVSR